MPVICSHILNRICPDLFPLRTLRRQSAFLHFIFPLVSSTPSICLWKHILFCAMELSNEQSHFSRVKLTSILMSTVLITTSSPKEVNGTDWKPPVIHSFNKCFLFTQHESHSRQLQRCWNESIDVVPDLMEMTV